MDNAQLTTPSTRQLTQRLDIDFALQAAGLGIWEFDPATGLATWDDRCRALFGLTQGSQITYQEAIAQLHPQDVELVQQALATALHPQRGGQYDVTFRVMGGDHSPVRWVRIQGRAEFIQTGGLHRFGGIAQDVTGQVLDRQEIERSQHQLLRQFEQSSVGIATISGPQLIFRSANPFYGQLVGRPPGQLVGSPLLEVMPELAGQGFDELLRRVMATGTPFVANEVAVQLIRSNQPETIYVDLHYQPQPHASGPNEPEPGVLVIATDVTAQVLARQAIEKSEARFRSLIEEAPVATCLFVGPDLVMEVINQPMLDVFGKGNQLQGMTLIEAVPELANQPFPAILRQVLLTGKTYEARGARAEMVKGGKRGSYYFDFTYKPLRNADGQVYAVLDMAMDVTEREVVWRALADSEVRSQSIIDLAELGSYSIDVPTQRITKSPRVADWYGLPEVTDVATSFKAIPQRDQERVGQVLADALRPGSEETYQVEYPIINQRTGLRRIVRTSGRVKWDSAGQPIQIDGIVMDVTAQRDLQLALEQQLDERTQALETSNKQLAASNQQLEETNGLLSRSNENLQQFAYVASHDLQEPLRKIESFGTLIKEQYGQQLGEGLDLLERMQSAASRMSILIRDLLSYSRIGTHRADHRPVSLGNVIANVLTDLEMVIAQTGTQLHIDPLPTVDGDSVQLGQLFQNLLSNALKFCRQDAAGGCIAPRITITSQLVAALDLPASVKPLQVASSYHRIDVADNGIGFDQKYLGRIFQVFQRLHGKQQYAGTGIGLAICEKVVTNHGGAITASSQPGQGATFSVYLPA